MAACSFKTEPQFKKLEKQVGSELATYTYFAYDGYPAMQTNTQLRKAINIPYATFNDQIPAIASRVRKYNYKNATAHHFKTTQIGQSQQVKIEFIPNYLPVNIEKQRQADFLREEKNKTLSDFQNKDLGEISKEDVSKYAKIKQDIEDDAVQEAMEEVYGITETIPELKVNILGNSQYEVAGEIYPSYEDALAAADPNPFGFTDVIAPELSTERVDVDLQNDITNMNPSIKLLDYLYPQGSQRLSKKEFYKEASELMLMMSADGTYKSHDIMEAIKCI